ncbi:MAG: acetolactate synthase [Proteobacteria bacterium]|nr:acetolactate synthase [Pseudomonadota bacterium]
MNGGDRVAEVLKAHGVKHIFTLCGGHISPILVSCKKEGIQVVDVRHEANAAFCADSVSRCSGIPGVVAVTAGPGVTNTLTAIKNAQLAQSPLILIGGATATMLRGRGSLQDINQLELIRPHVKWTARPNRLREVIPALEHAFKIAQEGVPGPVFVELAVDLLYDESVVRDWYKAKTDKPNPSLPERIVGSYIRFHLHRLFSKAKIDIQKPASLDLPQAIRGDIRQAAKMLRNAQKPVLVLGSQCMLHSGSAQELVYALEQIQAPVFLSGMARGLLGKGHPLQMRHKRSAALREADVVVLCGVPCDFRLDYGSHVRRCKLISINRSQDDLYQNRRPDLPILADPHITLCSIAKEGGFSPKDSWKNQLKTRNDAREQEILKMSEEKLLDHSNEDTPKERINPMAFFIELDKKLRDDSILVGDGGDFVATASYILSPRSPYSWLDPGVFGTLGVGAGFAMGAKLCNPDSDVWLIYGDGAAGFSIMEFDACVRNNIPIIAVVGNDAGWTQIARDQVVILKDDVATTLTHMNYDEVAKGCGAVGIKVEHEDDIPQALEQALLESRAGNPVLLNIIIGTTEFRKGSISM